MRNAARLFYFLKQHASSKFRLSDLPLIAESFSQYQLDTYIALLRKENWIGKDDNGYLYLRGHKFFKLKYGGNTKRDPSVRIPEGAVMNTQSWRDFIDGALVGFAALGFQKALRKSDRSKGASLKGGVNPTLLMSCSIFEKSFGVSRSEASRMRINGAKAGLLTNTINLHPTGYMIKHSDIANMREAHKDLGISQGCYYRLIAGELHLQLPNIIDVNTSYFKLKVS